MLNLAIVVGTRPEIIRLSSIIKCARTHFNVTLIHTGQNYDPNLSDVFFTDLSLDKPDVFLNCCRDNLGQAIGDIIAQSYNYFVEAKPDAVLILGDTNSCLCAYSAKRLKIPIFHVEAGNRCFDPNVPEEINRRIIDHISDINICYMEHARRNLLAEGIKSQYLFVVGSPMTEVINSISDQIESSDVLTRLNIEPRKYFVLSVHREENVNNSVKLGQIIDSIENLYKKYSLPIIMTVHPRTKKMLCNYPDRLNGVIFCEPFGIIDYCKLQKDSVCVISDSGTLTEESSIMNFKAVLLRDSTEHPEGIDNGTIMLGNVVWNHLETAIHMQINSPDKPLLPEYTADNVSHKVCEIIGGYTSIINKFIWMK